jgi:hypothetical protein
MVVFGTVATYSMVGGHQQFRGTHCSHIQGRREPNSKRGKLHRKGGENSVTKDRSFKSEQGLKKRERPPDNPTAFYKDQGSRP